MQFRNIPPPTEEDSDLDEQSGDDQFTLGGAGVRRQLPPKKGPGKYVHPPPKRRDIAKPDPVIRQNEQNIYIKNVSAIRVALMPYQVSTDKTVDNLHRIITGQLEGKCGVDGYVQPGSIKIINTSAGQLRGAVIEFDVTIEYNACNPAPGTVFKRACKCISVTKAGIHASLTDMHQNIPADIFVHRDLFPTNVEFNAIVRDDIFSVRTLYNRFELNDPRISIMCEVYATGDAVIETDDADLDLSPILERNFVDLQSLKRLLLKEECAIEKPTPPDYLVVYKISNDKTSYITRAIQEIPILNTKITSRGNRVKNSFMESWLAFPEMRTALKTSSDVTEEKWNLQNKFGYQMATTFMPAYAKQIISHFNAKRVLDPCAGWGDRLVAATAMGKHTADYDKEGTSSSYGNVEKYVCFDPNPTVRQGYAEIMGLFGISAIQDKTTNNYMQFENGYEVHTLPFEVGANQLKPSSFDLVFTSPPFFKFEVYTPDNPTYTNWIDEFYRPLMIHSYRCLQDGGHVCIHIDNTSSGNIEPFLRDEVEKITGLKFEGRIGVKGVMSDKTRSIWVYSKAKST